jgi:hypothetical protein
VVAAVAVIARGPDLLVLGLILTKKEEKLSFLMRN